MTYRAKCIGKRRRSEKRSWAIHCMLRWVRQSMARRYAAMIEADRLTFRARFAAGSETPFDWKEHFKKVFDRARENGLVVPVGTPSSSATNPEIIAEWIEVEE